MKQTLKLTICLLCIAAAMPSCGRTESNEQRADAMEKLERAWELQRQALSGTIYEEDKVRSGTGYDKTIEEYRQEKHLSAAEVARQISGAQLNAGQKSSAKLLVAQSQAAKAWKHARDAQLQWIRLADLNARLTSAASIIAQSNNLSGHYARMDYADDIAHTQKEIDQEVAARDRIADGIDKIEKEIASLQSQLKNLVTASQKKAAEADGYARQAFVTEGRAQYDLYVLAGDAMLASNNLTAQADAQRQKLDLAQSRLNVEQIRLSGIEDRLIALRGSLQNLQSLAAEAKKLSDDANAKAQSLVNEHFVLGNEDASGFEILTTTYADQVVVEFDHALEAMNEAIDAAGVAVRSGDSSVRAALELHEVALRVELGTMLRARALAEKDYQNLLNTLHVALADHNAQVAASLSDAIDASQQRQAQLAETTRQKMLPTFELIHRVTQGAGGDLGIVNAYSNAAHAAYLAVTGQEYVQPGSEAPAPGTEGPTGEEMPVDEPETTDESTGEPAPGAESDEESAETEEPTNP